jgi:hypothetical protein
VIDHRHASAWLYGAVRPGTDATFALVMTEVGAAAMQAFLDRFAATLPERVHVALLLDGAGWHTAGDIAVPANVSLVFLLPYSPKHLGQCPKSARARLALLARALSLAPAVRRSRRHPRRLLRRLEPPCRGARPHRLPDRLRLPAIGQDFMRWV